jgi:predicted transcriptional regulator
MMEKNKLLTPQEFAFRSGVSLSTIYNHCKSGKLDFKVGNLNNKEKKMIPASELKKYQQLNTH